MATTNNKITSTTDKQTISKTSTTDKQTINKSTKENKPKEKDKLKKKVDSFDNKQIYKVSLIWFLGIAMWFYFSNDKEKSKIAFKGSITGIIILFIIGLLWGIIKWLLKM